MVKDIVLHWGIWSGNLKELGEFREELRVWIRAVLEVEGGAG